MDGGDFGRREDDGDFKGRGEKGGWRMMCVAFGRVGWWIERGGCSGEGNMV